jgi:hypothetical protein
MQILINISSFISILTILRNTLTVIGKTCKECPMVESQYELSQTRNEQTTSRPKHGGKRGR